MVACNGIWFSLIPEISQCHPWISADLTATLVSKEKDIMHWWPPPTMGHGWTADTMGHWWTFGYTYSSYGVQLAILNVGIHIFATLG